MTEYTHTGPNGEYTVRISSKATLGRVSGVDRYEGSPSYGQLVLEQIYLWRNPYGATTADNLKGVLRDMDEVELVRYIDHEGERKYYVKAVVIHEGKTYPQSGWVSARLLEIQEGATIQ